MATSSRGKVLFSRLRALLTVQVSANISNRFKHSLVEGGPRAQYFAEMGNHVLEQGKIDISKWKKLDSRTFGITRSMISPASWTILKVLQSNGFEAYLVGGCVRDLCLRKVPKDFDVITTASLRQIKKHFHRAIIVGRRFPICIVNIKGSAIEVSSFETVAQHAEDKEKFLFSQTPRGCDKKDLVRWRNSMHRDFTINSLFFDPSVHKIYDYADGMMDLKSLKLRTLIPAQLSFKEDCARILRGLRIAARLGLSFSKETETAIHKLSSTVLRLDKTRLMMELNYMLSYGAAEPSLYLLRRFNLLQSLLPFHSAYLAQQTNKQFNESSVMLMKLIFHMDKLVTCDQPSDCSLWVGILAFHLALVKNPQDALVVWTFASVLYHGEWKEGVKFAKERAEAHIGFEPEILKVSDSISDEELVKRVSQLALLVQRSIGALTESDSLLQTMAKFPDLQCSGLVFIPRKAAEHVAHVFSVLVHNAVSLKKGRESFEIDYPKLGKGIVTETRFVLGMVILDTLSSRIAQGNKDVEGSKDHLHISDPIHNEEKSIGEKSDFVKKGTKKSQQASFNKHSEGTTEKKEEVLENDKSLEMAKSHQNIVESDIQNDCISQVEVTMQEVVENKKSLKTAKIHQNIVKSDIQVTKKKQKIEKRKKVVENNESVEMAKIHQNLVGSDIQNDSLSQVEVTKKKQKIEKKKDVENKKSLEKAKILQNLVESDIQNDCTSQVEVTKKKQKIKKRKEVVENNDSVETAKIHQNLVESDIQNNCISEVDVTKKKQKIKKRKEVVENKESEERGKIHDNIVESDIQNDCMSQVEGTGKKQKIEACPLSPKNALRGKQRQILPHEKAEKKQNFTEEEELCQVIGDKKRENISENEEKRVQRQKEVTEKKNSSPLLSSLFK